MTTTRLPLPAHYDRVQAASWAYRPDETALAPAAAAWRKTHAIKPSGADERPTSGVVKMHVVLNGSGAIDNICFEKESNGCTHTLGYWKTHAEQGPAGYDDTWDLIGPMGEYESFFLSGGTYFDAINASPGGNAYYQLSQQYIAAVLSKLSGASSAAVDDELADAKTLFETYTPAEIGALKGNNAVRQQFLSLSETLDQYNNGIIGPGHCDSNTVAD
jgi:hypothetical protein